MSSTISIRIDKRVLVLREPPKRMLADSSTSGGV
jgi:hypothetical protein